MKNIKYQMLIVIIVVVMFYLLSSVHKVDVKQTITSIVTEEILVPDFRDQQEAIHREYLKQGSEEVKIDIQKLEKNKYVYLVTLSTRTEEVDNPPFLEFIVGWSQKKDGDVKFMELRVVEE